MKPIRVSVNELLETVADNRKAHKLEWNEAMGNYLLTLHDKIGKLDSYVMRSTAQDFNAGDADLRLPSPPRNYLEEYDTAIDMLEWSEDEFIELEQDDFKRLVRDEWDWTLSYKNHITACNDINALR